MSDLKPCPRCGSDWTLVSMWAHESVSEADFFRVVCQKCEIQTRWWNNRPAAIADWNTRHDGWVLTSERLPDIHRPVIGETHCGRFYFYIVLQQQDDGKILFCECRSLWWSSECKEWVGEFEPLESKYYPKRWRYMLHLDP